MAISTRFSLPWVCLAAVAAHYEVQASSEHLEEVVVSAQKLEESLSATPVALSVFDADTLQALRVTDVAAIADYVPNLFISPTVGGSVNAAINIRGAATTVNNLSRDSSVGLYLDGVPIAKTSAAIFDVVDLQRIEVLRGPQGTLYGKNTIGGAINLVTVKPLGEWDAKIKIGAGNYNLQELRASLDFPALEIGNSKLSSKLSYFQRDRDGWVENPDPSTVDYDNRDQHGGRVDLNWAIGETWNIDYGYDRFSMDQRPTALQPVEHFDVLPPSLQFFSDAVKANTSEQRLESLENDSSLQSKADIEGHNLQLSYLIADAGSFGDIELKSISAIRELATQSSTDFDGTASDALRFINNNDFEQKTQEFQLIGKTETVDYVLGFFYYQDEWQTYNPRWLFQFGGDAFDTDNRAGDDDSIAAFGQMTWRPFVLEQRLALTAGLRWTKETKQVTRLRQDISTYNSDISAAGSCVCLRDINGQPITNDGSSAIGASADQLQALTAEDSWSETTPVIIAAYEYIENQHSYGKVSTGFKSGGFNGVATTNDAFLTAFDPETLTAYEVGFKNSLFDRRVMTQFAIFYNDYQDFQANVFVDDLGIAVDNAGKAAMSGVEFELQALLSDSWQMVLSYGYLDTEYKEYIDAGIDVKDERVFAYSPENSYSLGFIYSPESPATLRVDYTWVDDHWMDAKQEVPIDAYGLLSARLDFGFSFSGDDRFVVGVWGKNLTDEEYHLNGFNPGFARYASFGDPRTYGLELAYHYR